MKKILFITFLLICIIYFYLVLAVNTKSSELKEFREKESDTLKINDTVYMFKKSKNK